jgi:hypothetical protein
MRLTKDHHRWYDPTNRDETPWWDSGDDNGDEKKTNAKKSYKGYNGQKASAMA